MKPVVAILSTLDTKAAEAAWVAEQVEAAGGLARILDLGVLGEAGLDAHWPRGVVARSGGVELATLVERGSREAATPVMASGALALLSPLIERNDVHAVLGMGGTQGSSLCGTILQALPYGLPKILVSTVASGDTSPFVGVKDITMMFSVGDLLGLNPVTRRILANAAGAAVGMARVSVPIVAERSDRPVVGVTNLGVLTAGALHAVDLLTARGMETAVFHAVGSGGRAMEAMMEQGLIGAVFDYALGEISDALFGGLRAAHPQRLSVAGRLGLPQVLCPGGAEHVGLLVPTNTVPEPWRGHMHVFHSPVILAPRLSASQLRRVAAEIGRRLTAVNARGILMIPTAGTSRYSVAAGPLHDPLGDQAFFEALASAMPTTVEVRAHSGAAEDPDFVAAAVDALCEQILAAS